MNIQNFKSPFSFLLWISAPLFLVEPYAFSASCPEGSVVQNIQLQGLLNTQPHVVERELVNKVGEPFSTEKFNSEKLKLQDLDLFTEIEVDCDVSGKSWTGDDDENREGGNGGGIRSGNGSRAVTVTYKFKEIFRYIPAPAGKTSDRDGLMVGLALANLNVFGEDIRAEVQYRTAVDPIFDNNEYAFYSSSPYLFGLPLGWNFEFLRTNSYDDLRQFQDASWLLDLDMEWNMNSHFAVLGTGAYRYLEGGAGHLPEFGAGFAVDYRDAALDARRGIYQEYMLTHVGSGVQENHKGENYWEILSDSRAYWMFGRFVTGAMAFIRYRPGVVQQYDYYYHGGENTFRGHGADSLSLGVHEALLTLEERFVLMERHAASLWGVNFFYGVQLVWGLEGSLLWDEKKPGWEDYEGAVYGGLHLVIPALERIRIEVGYSPDRGEPKLFFGLCEKTTSVRWRAR
ncbi:MAG: BamA/TamA family outer membrane protein [Fibrobacteraceae bacterium]|nr:BamA/TamA family outer membrane protein [Fibrobacteraceae bacterium]